MLHLASRVMMTYQWSVTPTPRRSRYRIVAPRPAFLANPLAPRAPEAISDWQEKSGP